MQTLQSGSQATIGRTDSVEQGVGWLLAMFGVLIGFSALVIGLLSIDKASQKSVTPRPALTQNQPASGPDIGGL